MKSSVNFILPTIFLLISAAGCFWGEKKVEIHKSGRLEYIENLRYGPAGTHGGKAWYVYDRELKVGGRRWHPPEIDVKDISCEANPNEAVETLQCKSFKDMKQTVYIIRIRGDQAELVKASETESVNGDNWGSWADDGHWLLFRNYYFNVETSEKREVKGLPDDVDKYFIAASPDLKTIIYRDACYDFVRDDADEIVNMAEHIAQCDKARERHKNDVQAFWLIEAETGRVKILELKFTEYPFAQIPEHYLTVDWLKVFRNKLVWEKDENGQDRLAYPN